MIKPSETAIACSALCIIASGLIGGAVYPKADHVFILGVFILAGIIGAALGTIIGRG